jgi:ADP-heptose:LPS heptosyltransferase
LDPEEKQLFITRMEMDFPVLRSAKLVLVYPGGGLLPIRSWPLNHYHELVKGLIQKGYAVGIIGMREDKFLAEELRRVCGSRKCLDLTGYTRSVRELVFLLQKSVLLIGNDGGPAHFASIASTPAIVFFGPETPVLYAPLGNTAHFYHTPLACSPCLTAYNHRRSPCDGNNVCLKLISPASVLKKACELIRSSLPVRY